MEHLLKNPTRCPQIDKMSLTIITGNVLHEDIASQHLLVASLMLHLPSLNHGCTNVRAKQIFGGWADPVALMLLTMLPRATDVELFVYKRKVVAYPFMVGYYRPKDKLVILHPGLESLLASSLKQVKRLAILGGMVEFMQRCQNAEVVDVNLVGERGPDRSIFSNHLDKWSILRLSKPLHHVRTFILRCDWSLLYVDCQEECRLLANLLTVSHFPVLQRLEIYIARSPRTRPARGTSFEAIGIATARLAKTLQSLTIDYINGPDLKPKAILNRCWRIDDFGYFTSLQTLTVLQEVLISVTDRRRISSWESSTATFLPPALESLTIICPTTAVLQWLRVLSITGTLSSLRKIVLLCRMGYGAAPTEFEYV